MSRCLQTLCCATRRAGEPGDQEEELGEEGGPEVRLAVETKVVGNLQAESERHLKNGVSY